MRLTKVLRAKVEKELNEKRRSLDKKAKQNYQDRKEKATEEIQEYLKTTVVTEVQKILAKYDMDTDHVISDQAYFNEILAYRPHYIANQTEWSNLQREETDRYRKMDSMIEDFAIECELGVDKDEFFKALADLCSKFENEAK